MDHEMMLSPSADVEETQFMDATVLLVHHDSPPPPTVDVEEQHDGGPPNKNDDDEQEELPRGLRAGVLHASSSSPPAPIVQQGGDNDQEPPPRMSDPSLFVRSWPFVGRDEETKTIQEAYRRVQKKDLQPSALSSSTSSSSATSSPLCEFVVVEGPAGAGKSRLVREALRNDVVVVGMEATPNGILPCCDDDASRGYLCAGRFHPMRTRVDPQAAIVDAMNELVAAVTRRGGDDNERRRMSRCLSTALGDDRAALVEMVPSIRELFRVSDEDEEAPMEGDERLTSPESDTMRPMTSSIHDDRSVTSSALIDLMSRTDLNQNHGSSAGGQMNKFKHVVRRFLQAVASADHPLVLLLENVQWADETSLDFLWTLLSENQQNPGLLVVATYRVDTNTTTSSDGENQNSEVLPDPVARIWTKLQQEKSRVHVTLVKLPNLAPADVESLMTLVLEAETVATDTITTDRQPASSSVARLSTLMYEYTRGNPLLIHENVFHLRDLGLFTYNEGAARWEWDAEEVRVELSSNLSKVVRQRVLAFPPVTVETLKIVACLGNTVDEGVLSRLTSEPFHPSLEPAVERGLLIVDRSSGRYNFAHHEVRAQAYELIPVDDRKKVHSYLGRRLWESLSPYEVDKYMFHVLGQYLEGDHEYVCLRERKEIALLFARAGERAMVMSSFQSAYTFLSAAIECLGESRWRDSYTLSLNLHNAAAEVACCIGMYSKSESLVSDVIQHARIHDDTYRAQSTRIYSLGGRNLLLEAISVGLEVLKSLGVTFPSNPSRLYIWRQFMSMKLTLRRKYTHQSIMRLPFMTNPRSLAASQVLNLLYLYATSAKPQLAPLIGFALMRLTLKDGLCPLSCMGFVTFGMCLCGFGNDINTGYEYGQLALKLYEMFKGETWLVRLTAGYYGCIHPWKQPIPETWAPLKRAHRIGLESGDVEFSMMCISLYVWNCFDYGPLPTLESEIRDAADLMKLHGQLASLDNIKGVWQTTLNLMDQGGSENVWELNGDVLSRQQIAEWETSNYGLSIWAHSYEMLLCYLFGRYDDAAKVSYRCHSFIDHTLGTADVSGIVLVAGLSILAAERASPSQSPAKRGRMNRVRKYLRKLRNWARHAPHNFLGMQFLLEAELASLKGDNDGALSRFVCAIALNRDVKALLSVALSNERLGRHLLDLGQRSEGRRYLEESVKCYEEYGALAKVRHLQSELAADESAHGS